MAIESLGMAQMKGMPFLIEGFFLNIFSLFTTGRYVSKYVIHLQIIKENEYCFVSSRYSSPISELQIFMYDDSYILYSTERACLLLDSCRYTWLSLFYI